MGLVNVASSASAWRGHQYYLNKKVKEYQKISEIEYESIIIGSNHEKYNVFINIEHPRKSKCNCPHADGSRIVCKHMIALFFSVFPNEAEIYLKRQEELEREAEEWDQELDRKVLAHIKKMSKAELQQALIEVLDNCEDWIFNRFIRNNIDF